ncbi:MAG TPA: glycoside hydrolase [Thermoanaerobaculia bacterium]|nr:glycoside hydrolase [Thermoanaerobaculia bacterium]
MSLTAPLFLAVPSAAQPFPETLFSEMRWRMIGPFRAGRTVAASGIPGNTNVFYAAANNGGVWKTTDAGRVWTPIFDDQPTGSIGALAVAPSRPDTLYVGSGEGLQRPDLSVGDGIYKSTDAGKTWVHLGLRDAQQIAALAVHPRDPDRVYAAVLGHPYGANAERGVFRSTDGGKSWSKVLYKDENTGASAVTLDPSNPDVVYAALWAARLGPWENGEWQGPESGLFKSTDGGTTWRKLTKGLPTFEEGLGRIGICVSPVDSRRLYATVDASPEKAGIHVSDDAGESFTRTNGESRVWGRGSDFAEVRAHPKNRDEVWAANISTYRSTDGGKTFTPVKGAPGGDDYHTIFIHPENPDVILLAADQGATISVNAGATWSSWYNQPTAQLYHVSADDRFPYWVYGGQQESGSVAIASRGDAGAITSRDWHPVGAEEYGYVAPDPLDPDLVYGGKLTRFRHSTGSVQDVSPSLVPGKFRFLRTAPVLFSPADPRVLFYAGNVLFKTTDGGKTRDVVSPDLSREAPDVPESIGDDRRPDMAKQPRRGVIYTVAPGKKNVNVIWAGTDDGLVHRTADGGKTWANVTPPGLTAWSKVSLLEASPFDDLTAYAAVNRIRLDDLRPHVYRTHDGGKTWKEIAKGLPDDPVNAVREDPVRKGLLYAGTERMVHVSFDDGESWQPLRLNMPATSIRDLVVHGDDLVVGTHGRGFWILDDVTPLRQLDAKTASSAPFLYEPQVAIRVRRSRWTDTPLPPEEPAGRNPPDGAILDYVLASRPAAPVTLEILDEKGALVRRFSSDDAPEPLVDPLVIAPYWVRPPHILSATPGMHRFVWDLRFPPPRTNLHEYPISAVPGDTPKEPLGPFVLPGAYTVKLTVDGKAFARTLTVKLDPRVRMSAADLAQQLALLNRLAAALERLAAEPAPRDAEAKKRRASLEEQLVRLYGIIESADDAPTQQAVAAVDELAAR